MVLSSSSSAAAGGSSIMRRHGAATGLPFALCVIEQSSIPIASRAVAHRSLTSGGLMLDAAPPSVRARTGQ